MILAVLQARCSSTRLPGKVLEPVLGEPMIVRQIERLLRSSTLDGLIVATSTDPSDDQLAAALEQRNVQVIRGPLDDVASRFQIAVNTYDPSTIVRLTADCPLADHQVMDDVVNSHVKSGADYSSNVLERTYPQGLDVECLTASAFATMMKLSLSAAEREHVTMGIYTRPSEFSLNSVTQATDHSMLRWTVDLPPDLKFVRTVYDELYTDHPDFAQIDILRLIASRPELRHTN